MESLLKKIMIIFLIFMLLLSQCAYGIDEIEQTNSTSDIETSAEELRKEGMNVEVSTTENETETTTTIKINYEEKKLNGETIAEVKKFISNPGGYFVSGVMNILLVVADAFQIGINLVQTLSIGVYDDWTLKYGYERLEEDGEDGERNQYTQVEIYDYEDEYQSDDDDNYQNLVSEYEASDAQLKVLIDDSDGDNFLFEDTKIPIIYVDFYTMALNKVNALDINFFTGDENHEEDSMWMVIRNFVTGFVLVSYYIAAVLLITALIKTGVQIVVNSINPYQKAKDKENLDKLVNGVIMLVGTLVIMALAIFSYQAVLGEVYDEDSYELPIRVYFYQNWQGWWGIAGEHHENASFSTSFTGYIRFMAQIENPDKCGEKAVYTIAYVLLVIMNIIILVIMLIRSLVMWVLSIVGPLLAAIYAVTGNKNVMGWYKSWAFVYVVFALIQVIFAIVCVVLLNIMDFS